MSSQRLQAQRGQRPLSFMGPHTVTMPQEGPTDQRAGNRVSTGSGQAVPGLALHPEERTMSRGTDVTELPDRGTANTSPNGAQGSMGESEAPLSGDVHPSPRVSKRVTTQQQVKQQMRIEAGKNHEYFSGNTMFFWGGRLQNTAERPISILTATIMLIPALLFYIFS
jgi:palmitoyltransferase ZDHHC9/14/18